MCGNMQGSLLVTVLCAYLIRSSLACNGYDLKINYVRNCMSNSVIQTKDITATLDKDCNIIPSGCATITKAVKKGQAHYKIKKSPMPPMEGDMDMCEMLSDSNSSEMGQILSTFGMPDKCPVAPGKVCTNGKKLNISKYKNQLGILLGTTDVRLDVVHDNGKSCVELNMTVKRK